MRQITKSVFGHDVARERSVPNGAFSFVQLPKTPPSLKAYPPWAWWEKIDVVESENGCCRHGFEKTMDVCSRLVVFWGHGQGDFSVGLDVGGTKGGKLVNWGAGSKNCSPEIGGRSWNRKSARNGSLWESWISRPDRSAWFFKADPTVRVSRARTFKNGPKMQKKRLRQKLGLRVKNRVDVGKKLVVFGALPGHFCTIRHCKLCRIFVRIQPW